MVTPAQSYQYVLQGVKGLAQTPYALTKAAPIDGSQTPANLLRGSLASLNSSGNMVLGVGTPTRTNAAMPMFLADNGGSTNVIGETGNLNASGPYNYSTSSSTPGGTITAFVATGAFELMTSQINPATTFQYGDLLGAGATAGLIDSLAATTKTAGSPGVSVCGVVSQPKYANPNGINVIQFWPLFIPPCSAT